jgi:hypothetical protein
MGALGVIGASFVPVAAGAEEPRTRLAVIVGKDSPITSLSLFELKRLFMGEPVSAGGKRLIPLNHVPLSKERVGFDHTVLGLSADAAARYWIDRKIRGESGPPKAVDASDLLQRVVNRLEGAIGYVRVAEVSDEVQIVRIDGKMPSDGGYPIEY